MVTIEHEQREEIPWSQLIGEPEQRFDRRWLIVGGAAALVVVAIAGFRFLGTTGQPTPPPPSTVMLSETTGPETTVTAPAADLIVSEADLIALDDESVRSVATLRAEWFVHDWFTTDGSPETMASVRASLAPGTEEVVLPHESTTVNTYVEWAKAFAIAPSPGGGHLVDVAYRTIIADGADFIRQPVAAVRIHVQLIERVPVVVGAPETIETEWIRQPDS